MPDAPAKTEEQPKPKRKKLPTTALIVVAVALVEGIGFYAANTMFGGGPQTAYGSEGEHLTQGDDPQEEVKSSEIQVLKNFRVPNDKQGVLYMYDFDVFLKVAEVDAQSIQEKVDRHGGEISDRIARIVRAADPPMLREPDLKTLRLSIRQALGEIFGNPESILEVLIPRCVPIRSG